MSEFTTILPFSDMEEARRILEKFVIDFRDHGLRELVATLCKEFPPGRSLDFEISVGMAQGKPQVEIESVMEFARFDKKPIATFECGTRR
jgi:hypothetical protein